MKKEYREKLFEILDKMDELTEMQGIVPTEKEQPAVANIENMQADRIPPDTQEVEKFSGPNRDTTKRYSKEFKKMVVRLHRDEGRTCESITNEYGVSKATITKWCSDARYIDMAKMTTAENELQKAIEENRKIREENAFLKKVVILMCGSSMEVQP